MGKLDATRQPVGAALMHGCQRPTAHVVDHSRAKRRTGTVVSRVLNPDPWDVSHGLSHESLDIHGYQRSNRVRRSLGFRDRTGLNGLGWTLGQRLVNSRSGVRFSSRAQAHARRCQPLVPLAESSTWPGRFAPSSVLHASWCWMRALWLCNWPLRGTRRRALSAMMRRTWLWGSPFCPFVNSIGSHL